MIHLRRPCALVAVAAATLGATLAVKNASAQVLIDQVVEDSWRFTAGLGVFSRPKYPGSGDSDVVALPLVSANFGRYFIGGTPGAGLPFGVGVNLFQNQNWRAGVALGGELSKPRSASDAQILAGWGDIPATALGSAFAAYSIDWLTLRGFVVTDIGGKDQGTRVAFDIEGKYRFDERLTFTAGPGVTWADGKYSQTFFGVNGVQSFISGITPYAAGSGVNTVRFSIGAQYRLNAQWGLGASVTAAWLQGDAKDSPVTEKKSQNTYGLFASYSF